MELHMQLIKKAIEQEWKSKRFVKSLLGLADAEEDNVFKECPQRWMLTFAPNTTGCIMHELTQVETAET